jgi:hypothetical protein
MKVESETKMDAFHFLQYDPDKKLLLFCIGVVQLTGTKNHTLMRLTVMECEGIREKLGFYLDGTLDERTLEQVETHLGRCDECRRELATIRLLIDMAGQIEMDEPPAGLREKVLCAAADEDMSVRPPANASGRPGFMGWIRSRALPTARWAAGAALAGCAALLIMIATPHERVQKQVASHATRPAQTAVEKPRPQPKPAFIAESEPNEPAQVPHVGRQAGHYSKRHTPKHSVVAAARPTKSPTSHVGSARAVTPSGDKDVERKTDADAQDTDVSATQTAAAAEVAQNAEPVNEQPVVVKVAAAPVFDNEKIHEWMQQAKTQAEMRKNRDTRAMINIVSAKF